MINPRQNLPKHGPQDEDGALERSKGIDMLFVPRCGGARDVVWGVNDGVARIDCAM